MDAHKTKSLGARPMLMMSLLRRKEDGRSEGLIYRPPPLEERAQLLSACHIRMTRQERGSCKARPATLINSSIESIQIKNITCDIPMNILDMEYYLALETSLRGYEKVTSLTIT
jgi:hypothetical protein